MQPRVQQLILAFAALPPPWLKRGILGLLLLLICQQLATLTWRLWLPEPPVASLVLLAPAQANIPPLRTGVFTLFGRSPRTTTLTAVPDAALAGDIPLSSLQLTVTGIVASKQAQYAIAIIAKDSRQFSRGVGDAVPGYEARIVTIFADRIVLEHQGRYEALYLYQDVPSDNSARASVTRPSVATETLTTLHDTLKKEPMKVMDYLSVTPQMKDNALVGYRLNPGKKSELFRQLGLQENDLAVALNGLDLRDVQQGQQAIAQLPQLAEITLTIERDGQRQDISLGLEGAVEGSNEPGAVPRED